MGTSREEKWAAAAAEQRRTHTTRLRGASLIEMLVVVSILGIISALAAPNMMPAARGQRLYATAVGLAGFVDTARRQASSEGRCYRVKLNSSGAAIVERRNGSDCVNFASDGWDATTATFSAEKGQTFTLAALTTAATPVGDYSIVLRPNGRLVGDADLDVTDDGARITIADPQAQDTRAVIITAFGRVCLKDYGLTTPAVTDSGALTCP